MMILFIPYIPKSIRRIFSVMSPTTQPFLFHSPNPPFYQFIDRVDKHEMLTRKIFWNFTHGGVNLEFEGVGPVFDPYGAQWRRDKALRRRASRRLKPQIRSRLTSRPIDVQAICAVLPDVPGIALESDLANGTSNAGHTTGSPHALVPHGSLDSPPKKCHKKYR